MAWFRARTKKRGTLQQITQTSTLTLSLTQSLITGIPLHLLITGDAKEGLRSPISETSDCFRYLLKLYPESAGLRDLDGNNTYTLAVILGINRYYIRYSFYFLFPFLLISIVFSVTLVVFSRLLFYSIHGFRFF
jgi:hypothetical protein